MTKLISRQINNKYIKHALRGDECMIVGGLEGEFDQSVV